MGVVEVVEAQSFLGYIVYGKLDGWDMGMGTAEGKFVVLTTGDYGGSLGDEANALFAVEEIEETELRP